MSLKQEVLIVEIKDFKKKSSDIEVIYNNLISLEEFSSGLKNTPISIPEDAPSRIPRIWLESGDQHYTLTCSSEAIRLTWEPYNKDSETLHIIKTISLLKRVLDRINGPLFISNVEHVRHFELTYPQPVELMKKKIFQEALFKNDIENCRASFTSRSLWLEFVLLTSFGFAAERNLIKIHAGIESCLVNNSCSIAIEKVGDLFLNSTDLLEERKVWRFLS